MTEVGLIVLVELCGLSFAVALLRWLSARDTGGADVRRIGGALERAADAFLWKEFRTVGGAAAVLAAVSFGLHAAVVSHLPLGRLEAAFWAALGLGLGAGATCLVTRVGAKSALSASVRSLSAARHSLDRALVVAVRAGGGAGLVAETTSVLGIALLFGFVFAMKGGLTLPLSEAASLGLAVAALLPSFAVGAVCAALVVQRAGTLYQTASDMGADLGGERDAGLGHDDAKNPAVVADLVGDHVGHAAGRTVDLFVTSTLANVTCVLVGASAISVAAAAEPLLLALVFLPLVVRAFGVLASAFGIMVVRTDESTTVASALWRGQLTTLAVAAGGLAGASLWLLGDARWTAFFWSGLAGLIAVALAGHAARYRIDKRFGPLRDALEALRVGDGPTVLQGLGAGLGAAVFPVVVLGAALCGAYQLGASTELPFAGAIASLTAVAAMLCAGPYALALGSFAAIADSARGVSTMAGATLTPDMQRRTARLDDAGFVAAAVASPYLMSISAAAAVLAAGALSTQSGVNLAKPVVLWSGALGFVAVLAYAGNVVRAATRGARAVVLEVERQLRGFPKSQGRPTLPESFTPSYKACIELTSRSALSRLVGPIALGLSVPILLSAGLRVLYRTRDPGLWTEALTAFVVVSAVTGLSAALVFDGTGSTLSAARRATRPHGESLGFSASLGGDAVADVVRGSASSATSLLVKAFAIIALASTSFFTQQP